MGELKSFEEFVGQNWDTLHVQVRIKELHSGAVRVWYPGTIGTMDYRPDRLNVTVKKDGEIVNFYFG